MVHCVYDQLTNSNPHHFMCLKPLNSRFNITNINNATGLKTTLYHLFTHIIDRTESEFLPICPHFEPKIRL